jgi:uncharacterized protein
VKTTWIQFIPIIERVNDDGRTLIQTGDRVSDRTVTAQQWGSFLSGVFDEWVRHDVGHIFVQTFEAAARSWMGKPSGMCFYDETCGNGLALEHNGDLYSCDHFVEPDFLLGNITKDRMIDLVGSDFQRQFGRNKLELLPQFCLDCDVRFACNGECPKNRFINTPDGEPGLNYLCAGYKAFFHHIDTPMKLMAQLMHSNRPASGIMPMMAKLDAYQANLFAKAGRNDPCPCGSGTKYKKCHGSTLAAITVTS